MDGFFTFFFFLLLLLLTTGNLIQRFSCVKPQNIKWRKEGPRAYSLPTLGALLKHFLGHQYLENYCPTGCDPDVYICYIYPSLSFVSAQCLCSPH